MKGKDTFINDTAEKIMFTKEVPASILQGSIFRCDGTDYPAELCDNGDYIQQIQIRVENQNGDIYLSIKPVERGEWWSGKISWEEFFDLLMVMVRNSNKFRHHER